MSNKKRPSQIKIIPIDEINILNPRVRSQKVFYEITNNIAQVGLKRPITVTLSHTKASGKTYDLVCGQGRLEALLACGQTEIPALIIEADEEQALVMSLVENLARRQHRAMDLMQGIEILKKQGYDAKTISAKTGLTVEYVGGVLNLMENGEERLLAAVEAGYMPISLAIRVAFSPQDEQQALREAYENKQLRGNRLLMAKRLLDTRKRRGKTFQENQGSRSRRTAGVSTQQVIKVYQREVDRKRLLTRKADVVSNRLLFVTEALRRLFQEENFNNLLRAENLTTLPKPLAVLMEQKGTLHA